MGRINYKIWTPADIRTLVKNLDKTDAEIGVLVGRTKRAVFFARRRYELDKAENAGGYKPGHVPHNKGVKLEQFVKSPEALGRCKANQFKPGNVPANTHRAMYAVFEYTKKGDAPRLFIKLPKHKAYPYNRHVWEEHNSVQLTPGEVIRHINGNPLDCSVENLQKVTRAENIRLNENRDKQAKTIRKKKALLLKGLLDMGFAASDFQISRRRNTA